MDIFLEIYTLPKLKKEEIQNLNIPISSKDIEAAIIDIPKTRVQGQMASQGQNEVLRGEGAGGMG